MPDNDGISILLNSPRMCLTATFSIAALNLLKIESLDKVVVDFGVQAMYLPKNLVPALQLGLSYH